MNPAKLEIVARAIAHYEGFDVAGSIPQRTNNPGDLMFVHQEGATCYPVKGKDGKVRDYCQFGSLADGWAQLHAQIQRDASRDLTIAGWMAKYAPAEDANNPKSYAAFIAGKLGVTVETKLRDALA